MATKITSREQYEDEMRIAHHRLISAAQEEANEINADVDDILKYRTRKQSPQALADGLIEGGIQPLTVAEKDSFGAEVEFEGHKYLNIGDLWIMLDEIFPVQSENDFHLAGEILSGKLDLPQGTRLPTKDECKSQIFRGHILQQLGERYPDLFGDTPYFFLHSTSKPSYGVQAGGGWHPQYGGIIISTDTTPILINGGTSIDVAGKVPRTMKILLVRDNLFR